MVDGREQGGKTSNGQNGNKPKIQEYKFHLHDSAQSKTSKSFGKIKEAIIFLMLICFLQSLYRILNKIY